VWAQDLVLILANFSDVLDDLNIESTVALAGQPCDAQYRGSSTWDYISFEYRGTLVRERPQDIPEIGPVEPEDFGARYACGSLFIDRHRVHNALRGLVRWMVDTMVEISTGYPSIEQAIDAAFDCPAIAVDINAAWQRACGCSTNVTGVAQAACMSFEADITNRIATLIDEAAIKLSVVSLEGVAVVPDGARLIDGSWYGSLIGGKFPGSFEAAKQ